MASFHLFYVMIFPRNIKIILALSKLKVIADDNFSLAEIVQFFFHSVENTLVKGEKCW